MDSETKGIVYLLHFDEPLSHAQHYLGWTNDFKKRIQQHRNGGDAAKCKITAAFQLKGISFTVVRTWKGPISKEKELKRRKNGKSLCPICNPKP